MSNIIYFTENKTKGVQVSAELLDMLQTTEKTLEQAFVCMMGNNGIVCGCNNLGDGVYAEGLIIWNNELFVFKGGPLGAYIIVDSVTTNCVFCSGDTERIWTVRTAKFAASIPGDGTGIAVTADLPEFYHPEYTFFTLDAQVVQNTEDITNIQNDITDIQGDIVSLQDTDVQLQSQIDYLNSIVQMLFTRIEYIETNCCAETPPDSEFGFTNGTATSVCVLQAGSSQGKLQITGFNPTSTGADIASVQGVVAVRLSVGVLNLTYNIVPTDTLPFTSGLIPMSLAITSAIKSGTTGTIFVDVRFTDTATIEHIATFSLPLQSWVSGTPDPKCVNTVTITGPTIDEL